MPGHKHIVQPTSIAFAVEEASDRAIRMITLIVRMADAMNIRLMITSYVVGTSGFMGVSIWCDLPHGGATRRYHR